MKVYVEKLPKGCLSCPYIVDKGDYDLCAIKDCVIDDAFKYIDKRKKSCPLQSLADHTKQVRKEICEEIRSRFLATCQIEKGCDTASFSLEVLNRILDQIQDKGEQHG